jgi:hypothetical protein
MHALLAVLFGFMSLWHGPVMAFASAVPAAHAPARHSDHILRLNQSPAHHHVHQVNGDAPSESLPSTLPSCYGVGCFVAVDELLQHVPTTVLVLLGRLLPPEAPAMEGAFLDPPIPPPRTLSQSR